MLCPACKGETPPHLEACQHCGEDLPADLTRYAWRDQATASVYIDQTAAASVSAVDLKEGSDFGPRYRIEKLLGTGGMGKVYLAYDREIDRTVALKLVRPELAADPKVMARFRQELQLASRVSHRNIVRIHDLGEVDGVKFISMAYVEGSDLHEAMRKEGRLPFPRVLEIARQLCAALEAAHAEGVMHRDLKPRNILINTAGQACISDFGLAKAIGDDAGTMTRTTDFLGTPLYMSPEQFESHNLDHRSDIYSLGLIFYEMVTGEVPFSGESTVQVMYSRMTQTPKNPKALVRDLPDWFSAIITKCLAKNPDDRYQSAAEILRDLDAGKSPRRSLKARVPRPNRTWALVAITAVVAAGATLAIPALRERIFPSAAVAPATTYLAVLPFKPLGDSPELRYQAEGIVEALGAKLFSLKDVHLASSSAVDRANRLEAPEKIARDLGANLLVQGTVQSAAGRLKIIVSLWDRASNAETWRKSFDCLPESLLTTEDEIYNALVDKLNVKLSAQEVARGASRPTEDSAAYELYLQGRGLMRGKADEATYLASLKLFEQAIAKDARFARAYAGVAESSFALYGLTKEPDWLQKGVSAAQHAEDLDPHLPEVHLVTGIAYTDTGKYPEAIAELHRLVELAPNFDESYRRLGSAYLKSGKRDLALQSYLKAVQVNPYYWRNYNQLGVAYLGLKDMPKALEAFRKVTQLQPDYAGGYANMGAVYYRSGQWDLCGPAFRKALDLEKSSLNYQNLGVFTLYNGNAAEAVDLLEHAVTLAPKAAVNYANLGDADTVTGQKDKAAEAYKKAIELYHLAFRLNPKDAQALSGLGAVYAKSGDTREAEEFIHRARAIDPSDSNIAAKEAMVEHLAGHDGDSLKALREAIQLGYPARVAANDPFYKSLAGNAEFQQITAIHQ